MKNKSMKFVGGLLVALAFLAIFFFASAAKAETLEIRTPSQILRFEGYTKTLDTFGRDGDILFIGNPEVAAERSNPDIYQSGFERTLHEERGRWRVRVYTHQDVFDSEMSCISSFAFRALTDQRVTTLYCLEELS